MSNNYITEQVKPAVFPQKVNAPGTVTLFIFVAGKNDIRIAGVDRKCLGAKVNEAKNKCLFKVFLTRYILMRNRVLNKLSNKKIYVYRLRGMGNSISFEENESSFNMDLLTLGEVNRFWEKDGKYGAISNSNSDVKAVIVSTVSLSASEAKSYYTDNISYHTNVQRAYDKAYNADPLLLASSKSVRIENDSMDKAYEGSKAMFENHFEASSEDNKSNRLIDFSISSEIKIDNRMQENLKKMSDDFAKAVKMDKNLKEEMTDSVIQTIGMNPEDRARGPLTADIISGYRSEEEQTVMRRDRIFENLIYVVAKYEISLKEELYRKIAKNVYDEINNSYPDAITTEDNGDKFVDSISVEDVIKTGKYCGGKNFLQANNIDMFTKNLIDTVFKNKIKPELRENNHSIKQLLKGYPVEKRKQFMEEAQKMANETLPYRGKSDHHTGLALDFGFLPFTPERYKWLKNNAYKYGFINRFSAEAESDTGVGEEKWHWRYVGVEHATKMHKYHLTLDEYIKSSGWEKE